MAPRQYHGDDTWGIVGGLFAAIIQLAVAVVGLIVVGIREAIRVFQRRGL